MSTDKRSEYRLIFEKVVVFLEVRAPDPIAGRVAKIVLCKAKDISANGLHVELDATLEINAIHRLSVELPSYNERFDLVSEVKWCRPAENDLYGVGLIVFESDNSDVAKWKDAIADLLSP